MVPPPEGQQLTVRGYILRTPSGVFYRSPGPGQFSEPQLLLLFLFSNEPTIQGCL
jgi:hypothetical protein